MANVSYMEVTLPRCISYLQFLSEVKFSNTKTGFQLIIVSKINQFQIDSLPENFCLLEYAQTAVRNNKKPFKAI